MPDFSADFKDAATRRREPSKLECGLFGALSATIILAILFWLGIQFSFLKLIVQMS